MESRMRKSARFMPSPSMAVALLALFIALGGSAWAVAKVGTKQIKNNAVTTPKIKNGAVTAPKLKPGAVNGSKIADGAVAGAKLGTGAVTGPKISSGAVGTGALADLSVTAAKITPGAVGTEALANQSVTAAKIADGAVGGSKVAITSVNGNPVVIPVGNSGLATATCPEGKTAVSAGFQANSVEVAVYQHYVAGGTAFVYAASPAGSASPVQVTAQAVCI